MADDPVEVDDDEAEDGLPSHERLLLEAGLYRSFDLVGDHSYVRRMHMGPDLKFDAHCIYCERSSIFLQYFGNRGGGGTPTPDDTWLKPQTIRLEFRCQREKNHAYFYYLRVERQAITKIGQWPSLADIASYNTKRFRHVLEKQLLADLGRAIGLYAHGIGAGSFVYLRRIFEHLLIQAAQSARAKGEALEGFETKRMDEKIKSLAAHLPPEVVESAQTYAVLSAGIHSISEETCLSLFPIMRASIELILDGHLAARERDRHKLELRRAISDAAGQIARGLK